MDCPKIGLQLGSFPGLRSPGRLHIVSFDGFPEANLQPLLDNTEGTFTYIDPVLSYSQQ